MAVAKGEGAEIYAPLGQVIMGGLATSMLLTLYVMPTYYYILERTKLRRVYRKRRKADNGENANKKNKAVQVAAKEN